METLLTIRDWLDVFGFVAFVLIVAGFVIYWAGWLVWRRVRRLTRRLTPRS